MSGSGQRKTDADSGQAKRVPRNQTDVQYLMGQACKKVCMLLAMGYHAFLRIYKARNICDFVSGEA